MKEDVMYDDVFQRLAGSAFRSRFRLGPRETAYFKEKGEAVIRRHAEDFIAARIAPAHPLHDGKQTPMRGHPVFIAQHATACCCRKCVEKWHHFNDGTALTPNQQKYLTDLIMEWLARQMKD